MAVAPALRWMVDSSAWSPSTAEVDFLVGLLPRLSAHAVRKEPSPSAMRKMLVEELLVRAGLVPSPLSLAPALLPLPSRFAPSIA